MAGQQGVTVRGLDELLASLSEYAEQIPEMLSDAAWSGSLPLLEASRRTVPIGDSEHPGLLKSSVSRWRQTIKKEEGDRYLACVGWRKSTFPIAYYASFYEYGHQQAGTNERVAPGAALFFALQQVKTEIENIVVDSVVKKTDEFLGEGIGSGILSGS